MLTVKPIDLIELDYLSILEIIGEGAIELLQGQITSDMEKLTDNNCCLGALCNIKGRVESSFIVVKKPNFKDKYLLIGNQEVMGSTLNILKKSLNKELPGLIVSNPEASIYCILDFKNMDTLEDTLD